MLAGIDTSFFYALASGKKEALDIWEIGELVTSTLCLYELQKKLLKGDMKNWPAILNDIEKSVGVIPVTSEIALKAGHIAHGTGIPGFDSIIISTFLIAECEEIYTADSHFKQFQKQGINIKFLSL